MTEAARSLRPGEIEHDFADGVYRLQLALGQIEELQEKCNAGPGEIIARLRAGFLGPWRANDVRETIRLGLIGGGLRVDKSPAQTIGPAEAQLLVRRYVEPRLAYYIPLAMLVVHAGVTAPFGEEFPKSSPAATKRTRPGKTAKSASPPSTDGPASSASPRAKSTGSRSGNSIASSPDISAPMPPSQSRKPRQPMNFTGSSNGPAG